MLMGALAPEDAALAASIADDGNGAVFDAKFVFTSLLLLLLLLLLE